MATDRGRTCVMGLREWMGRKVVISRKTKEGSTGGKTNMAPEVRE